MSDFTPGPWKVEIIKSITGPWAYQIGNTGYTDIEELEANARLIAAAPEMYEALKAARDDNAEWLRKGNGSSITVGTMDEIDKALAKADGHDR